jgi:plasmid stabilization system protein ParE
VIPLSRAAEAAVEALADYYAALGRDRAIDNLIESLGTACERYSSEPDRLLPAPRPYPALADLGFLWTKQGPYWIAFATTNNGPVVAGLFHDTANIPHRL